MTINNQSLFSSSSAFSTQEVFGSRGINNNQWRGGVTGWKHSDRTSQSSGGNNGLSANEARTYLSDIKNAGNRLSKTTSDMRTNQSVFTNIMVQSSNTDALTTQTTNQNMVNAFFKSGGSMNVSISQLAASQQNKGNSMTATETSSVDNGFNHFSIQKDGKTFQFNIEVRETDSNRTVQQKTADAINRQRTGINATVEFDEKTKESTLVLTTRDTGEQQSFTIQDTNGNAIEELGISTVTRQAQNAEYNVNNEARTSQTNNVDLGNGFNAALLKVTETDKDAEITGSRNNNGINNAIRSMVNDFNKLRETASKNSQDRGAQNLMQRLDSLTSAYGTALRSTGITQNKDGFLQIDEKQLTAAIENGTAERSLGSNSGFTQRLDSIAKAADSNPNQFISHQSRTNINNNTPSVNDNFLDDIRFSAGQQNRLNNWNMVGMLLGIGM